ncbi:hypothetical protein D3C84_1066950 [compost metagenome]
MAGAHTAERQHRNSRDAGTPSRAKAGTSSHRPLTVGHGAGGGGDNAWSSADNRCRLVPGHNRET